MPELWTVRLRFEGRVRLGSGAGGGLLPSDRLYSTLCWGLRACWGEGTVQEYSAACLRGDPPWRVSSAFPFVEGTDFAPKPMLPLPAAWLQHARTLRSSPWVPLPAFSAWVSGQAGGDGMLVGAQQRLRGAMTEDSQAHLALDRVSAASSLYHTTALRFAPGSGLYFFLRLEDEAWIEFLRGALRVLEDSGIGGRRSAGLGYFRAEVGPAPDGCADWGETPSGAWCLLSRLSPAPASAGELLRDATFSVGEVGGWVADGQVRRKRIRLLTEGSVFRRWEPGRWVPVQPPDWTAHPVYRGGFAFGAPVSEGMLA